MPDGPSFVAAAEAAIALTSHAVIDMAYFGPRDQSPAETSEREVARADVYVGIIGLRYGTPVRDRPALSHTELEYETATRFEKPRLIFLVDDRAEEPRLAEPDVERRALQEAFRRRLMEESGLTIHIVSTPAELQAILSLALDRMARPDEDRARADLPGEALRWWRWDFAALAVALLVVAVAIAAAWFGVGLEQAAPVVTILALVAAAGVAFAWAQHSSRRPTVSTPEQLDAAARTLASLVERQWRDEVRTRQLMDPAPIPVRWRAADPELGDHRWLAGALSGRTDDVRYLSEAFRRLPQRRLVILGGAGAGKTTLAVLLTLALCDRLGDRDPVPVLLAPGSWNPAKEHLHTWVTRRLSEDYPALRARTFGPTAIEGLVGGRRVLPIVDGLDELPERSAREALVRIRHALADGDPLVVTCRTAEFQDMVGTSDVITAAAVIEAQDVDRRDVLAYLTQVVPPSQYGRWQPAADALEGGRAGSLAAALATPLMVSLLRMVYADGPADPADLVDAGRFPDRASIESHLLRALVPTAIARTRPRTTSGVRTWDVVASERWLSFLATHLDRLGTRDLRWWHLHGHPPNRAWRLGWGLVSGTLSGVVAGLGFSLLGGLRFGRVVGVSIGLVVGLVVAVRNRSLSEPTRANWQLRGRVGSLVRHVVVGVALGLGLVFGLGVGFPHAGSLVGGLELGICGGLVFGLMNWLQVPSADDRGATPPTTVRQTRALLLTAGASAVAVGLATTALRVPLAGAIWAGLVTGLVIEFTSGLLPGAWVPFVIVRSWLALRGRLPWRLMTFLDDCHRLGILRQVGPVYQFRHARLQDRLAQRAGDRRARSRTA